MKPFLTQKRAIERAQRVKPGITNHLYLKLEKGENFSGIGSYTFEVISIGEIWLDYCGKSVNHLNVNGFELSSEEIKKLWVNGSINLPAQHLKVGKNHVIVDFSNVYYHDGNGIHSFTDTDGKQYMYCQSEPFWTNKVYPVFDQPDLKGYMNFLIQGPAEWTVISNTNSEKTTTLDKYMSENCIKSAFENLVLKRRYCDFKSFRNDVSIRKFIQTPLLSTYLYTFIAGPFESVSYNDEDGPSVPMTIYCRGSLFEYAKKQKDDIFTFCRRGIIFYEEFFRTKYPFQKYDFVFCPEFTVGAMEYPGAVTFTDSFIIRDVPTSTQVTKRGMVILHELAHFWFGDLVTMKWWNDLWLNESFADFCCYLSMSVINQKLPFPVSDGWSMFQDRKSNGYNEDSEISTHPIAAEVDSTDKADSIFDGITYSKGASTLKQLYYLIGHDKFSECLGNYFKKYSWKNATLHDLLQEIKNVVTEKQEGPYDIDNWNKTWLESAGLTQIKCNFDPTVQGSTKLVIKQNAYLKEFPTLRYHKLKIAFFDAEAKVAEEKDIIIENKEETTIEFENKNYKAVLLNHGDWAFVKVELDEHSRAFFNENLAKISSDQVLAQLLIIRSLNDGVRDGIIKGDVFVDTILKGYLQSATNNSLVVENVSNFMNDALILYTKPENVVASSDKVFDVLCELIKKEEKADMLKILKAKFLTFARSPKAVNILKAILEGTTQDYKKVELTLEDEWLVVYKILPLAEYSMKQKQILIDYVTNKDNSDSKKYWLLTINAFLSDEKKAAEFWAELASITRKLSYTEMKAVFRGLNSGDRSIDLRQKFHDSFFTQALELIKTDQKINADTFFQSGFPNTHEFDKLIEKTKTLNAQLTKENEFFQIATLKKINDLERRKKAFGLYKK